MVVWLFAGGGESEVRGLIPFLEKNFTCTFERKTPVRRKPGPKPPTRKASQVSPGYGRTGRSLIRQIELQLSIALQHGRCDLILVVDDLDCHNALQREQRFLQAISRVSGTVNIQKCIGLAAPELEAWLIADWDNTIASHVDFRRDHQGMRWSLSAEKNVPFDRPETFSTYDPGKDSCQEKLSEAIITVAIEKGLTYSKATHTPLLLRELDPEIVGGKCPLFRKWCGYLSDFCLQ